MPVVPLIDEKDAAPEARAAYEDIEAHFGAVLDFSRRWLTSQGPWSQCGSCTRS